MKFSKKTVEILKNFGTINQGMAFTEGDEIITRNIAYNIISYAKIDEHIPKTFYIYNINEFLQTYSIFNDDVDITFEDDHLVLIGNKIVIKYYYSVPNKILSVNKTKLIIPSPENTPIEKRIDIYREFDIDIELLERIKKVSNTMKLSHIQFNDNGIKIYDRTKSNSNNVLLEVDMKLIEKNTNGVSINIDQIKLLPIEYHVEICNRVAHFKSINPNINIDYYLTFENED